MSSPLEAILKLQPTNLYGAPITSLEKLKATDGLLLDSRGLTSVPESIGQLTNLKALGLDNNEISSLPESIGQLTNLTLLYLWDNQLSSLPESIGQLTNLKKLHLYDNQLSSLPESIGQLTNLKKLHLYDNQLSSLPEFIGQLTNLTVLSLFNNQLSSLPGSIGQLTNLTVLYLYNNPITELPESITLLKNLQDFQIESEGKMTIQRAPIGIEELPCYSNTWKDDDMTMTCAEAFKKLKLYSNHNNENLTDISSLIGKWKACDRINISHNKISTLPDQLSMLTELNDFNIANNMFAKFPDVFLKMSWLTSLNIAGNSFIELPEGITKLAKLANLVIKDSNGKIAILHAPVNISTLPCYNANADLKKLTPPVQLPIVDFPAELQQFVLSVAPIFNKTKEDKLGEGGQATVYKGTFEGKSVAIKDIQTDAESMKHAAEEVILTKKITHPNIIDIKGVYRSPQGMLIVMELGSDSLKGMLDKKKGPLTPFEIVTFGKQIADALSHCVTQNPKEPIHHRDLKIENVLIVNGQAKLADFGLAHKGKRSGNTTLVRTKDGGGEQAGTPFWQGPEIFNVVCLSQSNTEELGGENSGHRGEKSDVYAFGLLLWSMTTGKYPFSGKFPDQIPPILLNGDRPEIPADVHPTLAHLIRACWRQNYKLRPRFSNLAGVLTMCGPGNLDAVSKDILNQLVPIRYSSIPDMYSGELYEYLTEQGVPQSIALKIRNRQTNGDSFSLYNAQKFVDTFKINEPEAQQLVSLQTLAPALQKQESTPQVPAVPIVPISPPAEKKSVTVASPPQSTRTAAPMQSQLSERTIRQPPPKPIAEMDTDELVAYLKLHKWIVPSFAKNVEESQISGEDFLYVIDEEILKSPPYKLSSLSVQKIMELITDLRKLYED